MRLKVNEYIRKNGTKNNSVQNKPKNNFNFLGIILIG